MSLLGNNIPVLPVTTCATWYTCQSPNKYIVILSGVISVLDIFMDENITFCIMLKMFIIVYTEDMLMYHEIRKHIKVT